MKIYLNDEKKIVDPRLLYDILRGLEALCAIRDSTEMMFEQSQSIDSVITFYLSTFLP